MRRASLIACFGLIGCGVPDLVAQRTSATAPEPGVMVVRSYACGLANVDSASTLLANTAGAVALELVAEGLLLDYQILKRTWGDEWDLVELFSAPDEDAFDYAFEELGLRLFVLDGARSRTSAFATLCPRRRDGRYVIVTTP